MYEYLFQYKYLFPTELYLGVIVIKSILQSYILLFIHLIIHITMESQNIQFNLLYWDHEIYNKITKSITSLIEKIIYPSYHTLQERYEHGLVPGKEFTRRVPNLSEKQLVEFLYDKIIGEKIVMNNIWNLSTEQKQDLWIERIKDAIEDRPQYNATQP